MGRTQCENQRRCGPGPINNSWRGQDAAGPNCFQSLIFTQVGPAISCFFGVKGYVSPEQNLREFGMSGELSPFGVMFAKLEASCLLARDRRTKSEPGVDVDAMRWHRGVVGASTHRCQTRRRRDVDAKRRRRGVAAASAHRPAATTPRRARIGPVATPRRRARRPQAFGAYLTALALDASPSTAFGAAYAVLAAAALLAGIVDAGAAGMSKAPMFIWAALASGIAYAALGE